MSEFCGPGDAAEIIGVTTETLRVWRIDDIGPEYYETDDGQVFYDLESVYTHVPPTSSTTEDFYDHDGGNVGGRLADGFAAMHGGLSEDKPGHYVDGTAFE